MGQTYRTVHQRHEFTEQDVWEAFDGVAKAVCGPENPEKWVALLRRSINEYLDMAKCPRTPQIVAVLLWTSYDAFRGSEFCSHVNHLLRQDQQEAMLPVAAFCKVMR